MNSYIYIWTNTVNGKRYIGKGTGRRATAHMLAAFAGDACPGFYPAIRKHGVEAFVLGFIATGLDAQTALRVEAAFIAMYGTKGEYNLTAGGAGGVEAANARWARPESKARAADTMRRVWTTDRKAESAALRHGASQARLDSAMPLFTGRGAKAFAKANHVSPSVFRSHLRKLGWVQAGEGRGAHWIMPARATT